MSIGVAGEFSLTTACGWACSSGSGYTAAVQSVWISVSTLVIAATENIQ